MFDKSSRSEAKLWTKRARAVGWGGSLPGGLPGGEPLRRLKMLFWRKPALTPTKNYENKTVCVFFQGASDGNAKIRRNISQKSKNNEKLNFQKNRFFENSNFHQDRCPDVFFGGFHPWNTPKIFQNPMYSHFSKIKIFLFMMNS